MLAVSPLWHFRILEVLDLTFSTIESNFALIHSHVMLYNKGFMNTGVIQVSTGTGIRVDRVLVAELLPVLRGYTIKLRYTYRIHGKPHTYKSEFKFDCIGKGKRIV